MDYTKHKPRGFMCKTDFDWELGEASGGDTIYPSIEELRRKRGCVEGCGIVEVEVSLVRVVQKETHDA
jgi:hypothetical protein